MIQFSGGYHICVNTADFERSLRFYKSLGFTEENQTGLHTEEVRMQYLIHPGSNALLEIIHYPGTVYFTPKSNGRKERIGLNHFGFHVPDIDELRRQLQVSKVKIIEDASRGIYHYIFAEGPDGEIIGFAEMKKPITESGRVKPD